MTRSSRFNPGIFDLVRLGIRQVFVFRLWLVLGIVLMFLQFIMVRSIWSAVYGNREEVDSISIHTTVTYLTIIAAMNFMFRSTIADDIHRRIDQGQVATDLVKPVGFVKQMLAQSIGDSLGHWILLIIVIPGLLIFGSLNPPARSDILPFAISVGLAYCLNLTIWLIIGLSGFWLFSVNGIRSLFGLSYQFLSGSLIPLWFMPGWLKQLVEILPFQAIAYAPASIYVQSTSSSAVWETLGLQSVWLVALGAMAKMMWSRAQRRIVVQGG